MSVLERNHLRIGPISGAFRLYDVDNDGYITREEMYDIVDAIYQMVVSMQSPTWPMRRAELSHYSMTAMEAFRSVSREHFTLWVRFFFFTHAAHITQGMSSPFSSPLGLSAASLVQ